MTSEETTNPGGAGAPERGTRPVVTSDGVQFTFADPESSLTGVSLVQEVAWPREGPAFERAAGGSFELWFERAPVDRFEYRFELAYADGGHETVLDPANDLLVPGAFGERSVIEFPEYEPPAWLAVEAPTGEADEIELASTILGTGQTALLWSSAGAGKDVPLPLLVALDGLEFARYSSLLQMLDAHVATGDLPPMRALLLHPADRTQDYTASPEFAAALATELIPAVEELVAVLPDRQARVGMGASLGGLAMMHAHRDHHELFGALFLQSSSFLHSGQIGAGPLERVQKFVDDVLLTGAWRSPIPVVMTCGSVEQNLSNNRDTTAVLCEQGYPAALHVNRDAHNWIGWRDAWTPHLVQLLQEVWR